MTTKKELFMVKCAEIPESICVETRFISHEAANQKRDEQVYYLVSKNGGFDLKRLEDLVSHYNPKPLNKNSTVTLSLPTKSSLNPVANDQQSLSTPTFHTGISTPNSNFNVSKNSVVGISLGSTSEVHPFQVNSSIVPTTPLAPTTSLNIAHIKPNFCDQLQQTDVSAFNQKSVAIQCNFEDLEDWYVDCPATHTESAKSTKNTEHEKERLLKYIKENSMEHKKWKECQICGEVCKTKQYLYGHMAIHQGPKALCAKCGQKFDHKKLLPQHKCRIDMQLEKSFLQCPHYTCNVKAVSRLELYDHINEHANNRMHKCTVCAKNFCTSQEYMRHLLIRSKCYNKAKRGGLRAYGLESQTDRLCRVRVFTLYTFKKSTTLVKTFLSQRVAKHGYCKICQKYFGSNFTYSRHRTICIKNFRKRLINKGRK